jgi:hypothetical protein
MDVTNIKRRNKVKDTHYKIKMEIPNDIILEYKKCIKLRKNTIVHNEKIKKKVRWMNAIFTLFFLSTFAAYYRPTYISGIYGDQLEYLVQSEYIYLVSNGWTNKNEIDSYLSEYREKKGHSYLVLGHEIYYIKDIPSMIEEKYSCISPIFYTISVFISVIRRISESCMSIMVLIKDSGNGIFRIDHIGSVLGNGVWIVSLHMLYWIILQIYYICTKSPFKAKLYSETTQISPYFQWVFINLDEDEEYDGPKLIPLDEMIHTINYPIPMENLPIIYEWIYNKITCMTDKHE